MGNSAYPRVEKDKSYSYKINRCTKPRKYPKNIRKLGRNGKEVTDINVKHKTPVVAMRDMQFFFAKDYSAENRCKEHKDQKIGDINITLPDPLDPKKKRKCITPYDMITIAFKDTLTGDVILYTGLSSTPLVPGFDGKCKRPYMHDRKDKNLGNLAGYLKGARFDHICGGPTKKNIKKGEIIGYSGKRGKKSSFGFNIKKRDKPYIIAPEDNFAWENFPNDKNRFLIPIITDSQIESLQIVSKMTDISKKSNFKNTVENKLSKYDESDENLNKLYKLIMEDEYFLKKNKYLKYSKKGQYNGKKIKTMGLAVFINYKKELSNITNDKNFNKISPFAWGWEYSYKDQTEFSGFKAIQKCYANVKKRKLQYSNGECIVVDFRRLIDDAKNTVKFQNYLLKERDNRILIAKKLKERKKTKEQLASEKKAKDELLAKQKKEAEEKEKKLLLAQKKAEEERKKQEKILLAKKKEEEKRKKELLLAQEKAENEKRKKELLRAQKKAEEERKKQEQLLAEKKAEEERKKQELIAQKKAEEERKKQEELAKKIAIEEEKRQKLLAEEKKKKEELLAKLKAEEEEELKKLELAKKEAEKEFEKKKKKLDVDKQSPEIIVADAVTVSSQVYKLKGKVKDKSDFFLEIDGQPIEIDSKGEFIFEGFIIDTDEGEVLTLVAVDRWNNSSEKNVKINVEIKEIQIVKTYEKLLPNKIKVKEDSNKIALVVGVEKYDNLENLDAIYANRDAKAFTAYANRAFGIPLGNIKVLIDKEASRSELIKAIKLWLPQVAKGGGKDIYIFFAGHGLASDDGENLFLLPQDGDSLLLEDTALSRSDIFKQISKLKPNSVTIFFDTCYSGQTRTEETLIAGLRPVRLVVDEQEIPNNFTIFSASSLTQTSGSIEQAKHGIFSYYLMKGIEGNADTNEDKKITNGELIAYLKKNVSEEAFINNRQQEPMLSGDPDKVLMSYR